MTDVTPPPAAPAPVASDGKTLGIIALVATFFISLLGIILGFVARSQSKKAGVKNTPATVAIVLGFIFLVLTIIWIIVAVVIGAAAFSGLAELCTQYGPGVHTLPDGTTLTCG